MSIIKGETDLSILDQIIHEALIGCEIWADLKISDEEFRFLTTKIQEALSIEPSAREYIRVLEKYPSCCVTQMVFHMINSPVDDFWGPWAEQLNITIENNQTRAIGQKVNATFKANGFTYDEDGYTYITPITCQAGIPHIYLKDLFEIVHDDGQRIFDPISIINELKGWKSYTVHKPVSRFINNYREKAITLLNDINDIKQSRSSNCLNADAYDDVLLNAFFEWETSRKNISTRRGAIQNDYPFPTIVFSEDGKGVCLLLPSIISHNEYASQITWVISVEGQKDMQVNRKYYNDFEKLYSNEALISITPASNYQIKLFDDIKQDTPLKEQRVIGLGDSCYLLFDSHGKRIYDNFLPNDSGYIICNRNHQIIFENINFNTIDMPINANAYTAYVFAPESSNARIRILSDSEDIVLRTHHFLLTSLVDTRCLFGEEAKSGMLPILTVFPNLSINKNEQEQWDDFSITLHHRQTGFKQTYMAKEIESSEDHLKLSSLFANENPFHGIYDIRIYEGSSFRKNMSFIYVPDVQYVDDGLSPWPHKSSSAKRTGFSYVCPKNVSIQIQSDANTSLENQDGQTWTRVWLDAARSTITGTIAFDSGSVSTVITWIKTVRFLSWSFWDESKLESEHCFETRLFTETDLKDSKYWLLLWMQRSELDNIPIIELRNKSGNILQTMEINMANSGKCAISFNSFATTIENNKLPIDFVLCFRSRGILHQVVLAHLSESVILSNLQYQNDERTKDRPVLFWKADHPTPSTPVSIRGITETDFELTIAFDKVRYSEQQIKYYLYLQQALPAGLYKVEPQVMEDFFAEDSGYRPPILQGENMLYVNVNDLEKNIKNLVGLLKLILVCSNKLQSLERISHFIEKNSEKISVDVNDTVCKLLSCLIVNFAEEEDARSQLIMQLIDLINTRLLSDVHRTRISKQMLTYSLSDAKIKLCFHKLRLWLFKADIKSDISFEEIRKIGELSSEWELLWMLRTKRQKGLVQKLKNTVGPDTLKEILCFKPSRLCYNPLWDTCLENVINNQCACTNVVISKNLCGISEDFRNMFDWGVGYAKPWLDLKRRPLTGTYFCGKTYIDLIITWYLNASKGNRNPSDYAESVHRLYPQLDTLIGCMFTKMKGITSKYLLNMAGRNMGIDDGFYPLFYYCAISALASSFYSHDLISEEEYAPAQSFLISMIAIFPQLVQWDLLLCELILFFERGI